ncbi:hypothetical protein ADP71_40490 [Vitreoscilla sp. C1]|nr:hypothetical protein ADP71_40490 [Vitreoscilla sp. C1]
MIESQCVHDEHSFVNFRNLKAQLGGQEVRKPYKDGWSYFPYGYCIPHPLDHDFDALLPKQ